MIVFARMGLDTPRLQVVYGMVDRGAGHGPAAAGLYARGSERRAPAPNGGGHFVHDLFSIDWKHRRRRGFGSIMLTRYHREFAQAMPAQVPPAALPYFSNPLLLVQVRPPTRSGVQPRAGRSCAAATAVCERETSLESGCT